MGGEDRQPGVARDGRDRLRARHPDHDLSGTGEANFWSFTYGGAGLLKSVDNGASWSLLAQPVCDGNAFSAIPVDPNDANTLLASFVSGNFGRQTSIDVLPGADLDEATLRERCRHAYARHDRASGGPLIAG